MRQSSDRSSRSGLLLGVLMLAGGGYSLVQSLVVPALPTLQLRLDTTPTGATWVFTAFLLSSAVATPLAGRLGDMFGRRRVLLWHARRTLARHPRRGAHRLARRDDRRARGAGPRRGDLPARLRDHPRRVRRGRRGARDGVDVGRARRRRRARDRARRADPPAPLLPLAVLGPARGRRRERDRRVPRGARPTRTARRRRLLAGRAAARRMARLPAASRSARGPPGAGRRRGSSCCSCRRCCCCVAWIDVEERARVPLVDLQMLRIRGVWTTNAAAVLVGWGTYSAFVLIPEHVEAPTSTGGFGASVATAGLYLVPWTGAVAVASALSGRLSARFGSRVPLIIGYGDRHGRVRVADRAARPPVADHRGVDAARRGNRLRLRVDGEPRDRERRRPSRRASRRACTS